MGVTFDGSPSFTDIMNRLNDITNGEGKAKRHLRLVNGSTLYTHDPGKWHGLNYFARRRKHASAYEFVRTALIDEFGPNAADRVLKAAGIDRKKSITVRDLQTLDLKVQEDLPNCGHYHLSDTENARIAAEWVDMFDGKQSRTSDDALHPQYEADACRQTRRFNKGGVSYELQAKLSELETPARVPAMRRAMHEFVKGKDDSPEVTREKSYRNSRLLNQEFVAPTYKVVEAIIGGGLATDPQRLKTEFDVTELDGGRSYKIQMSHHRNVNYFVRSGGAAIPLLIDDSYVKIEQELLVTSDFLQGKSKQGLTVRWTRFESRLVEDRSQ